jgi:subtilisin family serine protease
MIGVLIKGDVAFLKEEIKRQGGNFKYNAGNIVSATIPVSSLSKLSKMEQVQRMEEGAIQIQAMNDRMLINNKIDKVHQGVLPLTQGYKGKGSIVGIIDTGIDFTHPDFRDTLGNTRVLWIWDHLLANAANTPQPYNYGQEFSQSDIDGGLAAAHIDGTAHGTHVSGIATSNGNSHKEYTGAAPEADIIAVSVNFNTDYDSFLSSIADAVEYIYNKADSLGKPCVINISAGTYYGSHDGKDLQAQAIDNMITARPARSLVASAGNAGNYYMHLQHNPIVGDTTFTWFNNSSAIYIEFWADTADLNGVTFAIGVDKVSPTFSDRGSNAWSGISPYLNILSTDTLYSYSGNRIALYQTYGQLIGGNYSMIFYIVPDSTTYNFRLMSTGNGKFDCWSFDMINSGLPAPSGYPAIVNYTLPDLNQTICSSFQCSDKVITVGQYVNRNSYVDVNGVLQTFPTTEGALAASSSHGPTRTGLIKPDITSTGEVTLSALRLSSVAWFLANQAFKLAPDSIHIRDGGTSSAAPVIAGIGALYFEKYPNDNWNDFKTKVTHCAVVDGFTGTNLPSNAWGYGKVDAFAVMSGNGCTTGIVDNKLNQDYLIYPNPASNNFTIQFNDNKSKGKVEIFNLLGENLKSFSFNNQSSLVINREKLASGIYFIQIKTQDSTIIKRVIFE